MSKRLIIYGLSLVALLSVPGLYAANGDSITVSGGGCNNDPPPRYKMSANSFLVVAESGNLSDLGTCPITIHFDTSITTESAGTLKNVIDTARKKVRSTFVVVALNSNGGDVWEALSVARHIRESDDRYVMMAVGTHDHCISACVIILAGGFKRSVAGEVAIHRPYLPADRVNRMGYSDLRQAYDAIYADLSQFFYEVNIDERLAKDMWQVPSHRVKVLSEYELATYGLSEDDAILTEINNSDLRAVCGENAPTHREDYFENVLHPCMDSDANVDSECLNRRGRKHPYCPCIANANSSSGIICD